MATDQPVPGDRHVLPEARTDVTPDSPTADPNLLTSPGRPDAPLPPSPSSTWGGLEILESLGRGGFGSVYRARDPALDREVALKLIVVPSRDPARVGEVLREGRLLARIRHPNVVMVHAAQEHQGVVGIWMEFVQGRTLAEIVGTGGPMGPEEASVIGVSVCRALAAVHGAQLIHRDVKAQNVMREAGGRIVLMDFGAGWEPTQAKRSGAVEATGTPLYMAPELFAGRAPTVASDIYSLGVLLFFLVSGTHPVEGRSITDIVLAHGLGQRRLLADVRPDLPDAFVKIVERALATSPEHRYATAGAMMRDLEETISRREDRREAPVPPAPEPRPRPWWAPWTIGAAAVFGSIWLLGLVTSLAFDLTLGRLGGFSNESVFAWWIWGLRSLVAPMAYVVFALGVMWVAGLGWRLLHRVGAVRSLASRVASGARSAAARARIDNPVAAGQVLLVLQIAALSWFYWRFHELFAAFGSYISTGDAATLAPLAPANEGAHDAYRLLLPLIILGMVLAWVRVWRWQRHAQPGAERAPVAIGVTLIVVAMLLLELPYRILRHNEFLRVALGGERCYVIGERDQELLLYCPDGEIPRNRVIPANEPRLERTTQVESIFTPRAPGARGR